eukprot:scaffold4170_cov330-Prasinococcus_capsulatus_cf.AAC.7
MASPPRASGGYTRRAARRGWAGLARRRQAITPVDDGGCSLHRCRSDTDGERRGSSRETAPRSACAAPSTVALRALAVFGRNSRSNAPLRLATGSATVRATCLLSKVVDGDGGRTCI